MDVDRRSQTIDSCQGHAPSSTSVLCERTEGKSKVVGVREGARTRRRLSRCSAEAKWSETLPARRIRRASRIRAPGQRGKAECDWRTAMDRSQACTPMSWTAMRCTTHVPCTISRV